ncbi:myosin-1-like protein isoform X1, partial [Tanacetum coccineum]
MPLIARIQHPFIVEFKEAFVEKAVNVTFSVIDNQNHVEPVIDEALQSVANLLGCEAEQLQIALSTRNLTVGSENIVQKLTLAQGNVGLDYLSAFLISMDSNHLMYVP